MTRHRLTIAVAGAAIALSVAIPALTLARSAPSKTDTLRVFDKPVAITLTNQNGTVSRNPTGAPEPGDVLDVYSLDFAGNHQHHAKNWSMSTHLECKFGVGKPDCVSHVAVGNSLLIFDGNKLVGGTGRYLGATGRVISNKDVGGNTSDVVVAVHRR
jgi:hypothetical protein